ncbi:MAG: CoA transferase [Kiloniellales bacterium]|nr:CoA transferase [Kiloniellales bacterium]
MLDACLAGFRVVDLSQYLPGPFAGQILADLGAEVVKVEPPGGDPMRGIGPPDPDGVSAYYKLVNAGKRVVRIDLKAEAGRATFSDLIAAGDVLLESYRPGVLARLGFDRHVLTKLNPRLIHCALSGYGQTGPYSGKGGHDLNYLAWGGGLVSSGSAARPVISHPPVADHAGALQAVIAILAALLRRERGGAGALLDVSLAEAVLAWQGGQLTAALRGRPMTRGRDLLNGGAACYGIYETADGRFVTLGALEPKFWAAFCEAVGRRDWIDRQAEPLPQDDLIAEVAAFFERRSLAEWRAELDGIDCCWQPVLDAEDLLADTHAMARGLLQRSGDLVEVLFPALMDDRASAPRRPLEEVSADDVLQAWRSA